MLVNNHPIAIDIKLALARRGNSDNLHQLIAGGISVEIQGGFEIDLLQRTAGRLGGELSFVEE